MNDAFLVGPGKEFVQSAGRERNTAQPFSAISFWKLYFNNRISLFDADPFIGQAPDFFPPLVPQPNYHLTCPQQYHAQIMIADTFVRTSIGIGEGLPIIPLGRGIVPFPLGTKFKLTLRTWGVTGLHNPRIVPPLIDGGTWNGKHFQAYDSNIPIVFDHTSIFGMPDLLGVYPSNQIVLNACDPSLLVEPKGLWEMDRIIIAYGQKTVVPDFPGQIDRDADWGISARLFTNVLAPRIDGSQAPFGVDFDGGQKQLLSYEPNVTLLNPQTPIPTDQIHDRFGRNPNDLFDLVVGQGSEFNAARVYFGNGMAVVWTDFEVVTTTGNLQYFDLKMRQVSQLRS